MRGIVAATDGRQQPTDRRASNERNEAMDRLHHRHERHVHKPNGMGYRHKIQ